MSEVARGSRKSGIHVEGRLRLPPRFRALSHTRRGIAWEIGRRLILVRLERAEGIISRNIDQFNAFTAALLELLYDSFPIPMRIRVEDFAASPDLHRWLLRIEAAGNAPTDEENPFARAEATAREHERLTADLKLHDHLKAVFRGTIQFLLAEGFIRCDPEISDANVYLGCQLTAKGLVQLNKKFEDKKLAEGNTFIIGWLKNRFSTTASVEGAVASQMLGGVIGRLLG